MKKITIAALFTSGFLSLTACSNLPIQTDYPYTSNDKASSVCVAQTTQQLIGKNASISDKEIKELTNAEIVRRVNIGNPISMDYRENRITILINPITNKITEATCG